MERDVAIDRKRRSEAERADAADRVAGDGLDFVSTKHAGFGAER